MVGRAAVRVTTAASGPAAAGALCVDDHLVAVDEVHIGSCLREQADRLEHVAPGELLASVHERREVASHRTQRLLRPLPGGARSRQWRGPGWSSSAWASLAARRPRRGGRAPTRRRSGRPRSRGIAAPAGQCPPRGPGPARSGVAPRSLTLTATEFAQRPPDRVRAVVPELALQLADLLHELADAVVLAAQPLLRSLELLPARAARTWAVAVAASSPMMWSRTLSCCCLGLELGLAARGELVGRSHGLLRDRRQSGTSTGGPRPRPGPAGRRRRTGRRARPAGGGPTR